MRTFDKVIAKKLREEIETALKGLSEKYDIEIRTGSCTYSETEIKYRLEIKTRDKEVIAMKEKTRWDDYCRLLGFEKTDFGKTFEVKGETYRITGCDLGRSKFDLVTIRISDNKTMLWKSEQIKKKFHPETTTDKVNSALNIALNEVQ